VFSWLQFLGKCSDASFSFFSISTSFTAATTASTSGSGSCGSEWSDLSDIENETHQQVIQRIKAGANHTTLLVLDREGDDYYKSKGMTIQKSTCTKSDMSITVIYHAVSLTVLYVCIKHVHIIDILPLGGFEHCLTIYNSEDIV
jgi:hypothetical protein